MSIDIDWTALTSGDDGAALAESIRVFIHDRFQQVTLPKFIRSVHVHSFDFGTVAPELEVKDVCDPLPDFYDDEDVDGDEEEQEEAEAEEAPVGDASAEAPTTSENARAGGHVSQFRQSQEPLPPRLDTRNSQAHPQPPRLEHSLLSRASPPALPVPGGTSNLNNYFHLPLSAGLNGTATPLAAVAGAHGWNDRLGNVDHPLHSHRNYFPAFAAPHDSLNRETLNQLKRPSELDQDAPLASEVPPSNPEQSVNDVQIVAHLQYSGDVKLSLTADILLDYPMPSFVGIPLQLNVTGLTFDGVALIAYIKHKAHFCFLAPEDADALVGGDAASSPIAALHDEKKSGLNDASDTMDTGLRNKPEEYRKPVGGLFEEIKVESEIGQRVDGKQSLKNVGKVEKFVLEQVRRIFETEFVYPSFWTFLV